MAAQIIEELKRLQREEQAKVIVRVWHAAENLSHGPAKFGELARRVIEVKDPAETDRFQQKIERRFYGADAHG